VKRIEATLNVVITYVSGVQVTDLDHLAAHFAADGAWFEGNARNSVDYNVCAEHPNPDDCDGECGDATSVYRIRFDGVNHIAEYGDEL
jgi:hypothetical protein